MSAKLAVYPGYFDPFTLGHKNIVDRACKVFDKLIVAVAKESPKTELFSLDERTDIIRSLFRDRPNVIVDQFDGLLVEYLHKKGTNILLRGIRTVSDFEYEYQMTLANRRLAPDVETFFMTTDEDYSFLSSTLIKEIARLGGDISSMVPPVVLNRIRDKYETQR